MSSVLDIIPPLPLASAGAVLHTGGKPQSRAEVVAGAAGSLPGAEVTLQKLLKVRGEIGGPDKAKAEREAPVREFHGAPVTYDGFASARQPPVFSIYLVA